MAEKNEKEKAVNEQIRDFGQVELEHGEDRISMLTIIGEIEGHECLPAATKTTKYEHVLPKLAEVEENKNVDGLLLLLNTVLGSSSRSWVLMLPLLEQRVRVPRFSPTTPAVEC